jgi:hypothetical protein
MTAPEGRLDEPKGLDVAAAPPARTQVRADALGGARVELTVDECAEQRAQPVMPQRCHGP